jgi:hypothetical protein
VLLDALFILTSLVIVIVLAAEIYLRLRYDSQLRIRIYPQVYVPDEKLGYRYRPNTEGEIRIPGIHRHFRTNSHGFHSPEISEAKPTGTYRIACIGPSNTTGIWMDGDEKNFSRLLEEKLRADGHHIEVMNFGIDGRYRSVHELRVIDTDVAVFQPDLVLLDVELPFVYGEFRRDVYRNYVMIYNAENELSRKWCERIIDDIYARRFLIRLYRTSYIVRATSRLYANRYPARSLKLRVFIENRIQAPDIALLPYSIKKSVEALQETRTKLEGRGSQLILFQYSDNQYFRQVAAKYDLPYLELEVPATPKYVHDHDGHYRHAGHVEVANQLYKHLTSRKLFEART